MMNDKSILVTGEAELLDALLFSESRNPSNLQTQMTTANFLDLHSVRLIRRLLQGSIALCW
jgi:hypothetical protein